MRFVRLVALVCPLFVSFAADAAAETRHAADARRLAERTFPSFLGRSTGTPATLPRGMRIETPLSTTAAKVETATGQPAGRQVGPRLLDRNA